PERIAFSPADYRRFVCGEDEVFPLDTVRDDLRHNTNVVFAKGKPVYDTRRPRILTARVAMIEPGPIRARAGEPYNVRVSVINTGDTTWLAKPGGVAGLVTLGVRLHDEARQPIDLDYGRGWLSADVAPGQQHEIDVTLVAPRRAGVYHVELDM